MSNDKLLQAPYFTGDDLYVRMAMDLYKFDREFCVDGAYDPTGTFQPRKRSKTGLLAAMYGTSKWTLAQQMKITVDEAEAFLENFFTTYDDVDAFIKWTQEFVYQNEYVETMFGRKRRFPGFRRMMDERRDLERRINRLGWKNAPESLKERLRELRKNTNGVLRAAVNARIQGSAADVMKLIIAKMYELATRKGWKMLATVHDQIDLLVPDTITPDDIAEVEAIMTETVKLAVPMKCDTTLGYTWGSEIPWREWFEMKPEEKVVA